LKAKVLIIFLGIIAGLIPLNAQVTPELDTLGTSNIDSILQSIIPDSTSIAIDTSIFPVDSNIQVVNNQATPPAISEDALESEVESFGEDSMRYDIKNSEIHLWGNAYVKYETITLTADYIVFNWNTNIVTAEGITDTLGNTTGLPNFQDGEEAFDASKLRYNFKTSKGIIYDAVSQYNDLYVRGGKAKFVGKGAEDHVAEDHIYSSDAIFTTCNHPEPHFGIRSKKQKVVPGKVVVVGPSNIELGGVPTPLYLPFGFFPLKQGKRTGLMFQDYEYSEQWGFGLKSVGWYFPINDYLDVILTGDIYSRGTYRVNANSRYRKRYKYDGGVTLSYSDLRNESTENLDISHVKSFGIRWNHNQAATAHPTNTFGGSINLQTNNHQSNTENDVESVFDNQISSNLNYRKIFPGKPITFNASFNHSQNSKTRAVFIDFPNLSFNMTRVNPFEGMRKPGKPEQWYEKIAFTYRADAKNRFETTDTSLFTQQTLTDAKYGVKHNIGMNASGFTFLKHFNFGVNANYQEVWNFKYLEKQFDPTLVVDTIWINEIENTFTLDTIAYGTVIDDIKNGFQPLRVFNTSASLNTTVYGLMQFKKGWLRGLRHVMRPDISLNYAPDYTTDFWNYFREVQTDTRYDGTNDEFIEEYSIFSGGVSAFNDQPSSAGQNLSIGYGINNTFEGKYYSKKDSTMKKFKMLKNIIIRGNYNIAADSFQWSLVNMSGTTPLFKNLSTLNLAAVFDPYVFEDGRRMNKTMLKEEGKLFRFAQATATIRTSFTIKKLRDLFGGKDKSVKPASTARPKVGQESLLDMLNNFSLNHTINTSLNRIESNGLPKDTFQISAHSLSLQGNIQLTEKWRIGINNISYNFMAKRLIYPSLSFYRDLHCWELSMNWTPERDIFTFSLKVKPGSMDFLKVPYQRNRADGAGFGGF